MGHLSDTSATDREVMRELGRRLAALREAQRLTMLEAAERAGPCPRQTLYRAERGQKPHAPHDRATASSLRPARRSGELHPRARDLPDGRPRRAAGEVVWATVLADAEVRLWGETVGAVVELDNGRILFEYADTFRRRGLNISPIHLPTSREGPRAFDELLRRPAFRGLPGVLADSLPDAFGNKSHPRVLRGPRRVGTGRSVPVQRLLYVGERALGALTFHPAEDIPTREAELESLEVAALVP